MNSSATMTIEEAIKRKAAMEKQIFEAITIFQRQTGCRVDSIDLKQAMSVQGSSQLAWLKTKVELN